jgi:predicted AlkP superfamily phosphohydrolase/phosphomutase
VRSISPVTSPNWKAYSTGKNPGKIGIYWWENVDTGRRRVYYPTDRKHANTEFWELIAESDPVGVLGVPTTYPPKPVDGFLVAGAPDGENSGYTHPADLEAELEDRFDYRVLKNGKIAEDGDRAAEEILDLIDTRFTAARALFEERDLSFLQVTTFYLNSLHHFLWDDEYTRRAWELVDEHLEPYLEEDHDVVLMSDHGSTEIRTVFHVNAWLEREGFLTLDTGVADTLHRLGITTDRMSRLAGRVGARRFAKRWAPEWLYNNLPDAEGQLRRESKTDNVDWDETRALASGQGPLYLTMDRTDPDYEPVRTELIDRLEGLSDPDGNPVAEAVYRGEDVYEGPYVEDAPDIVVDQAPGVHIPGSIGRDGVFTPPDEDGWRA